MAFPTAVLALVGLFVVLIVVPGLLFALLLSNPIVGDAIRWIFGTLEAIAGAIHDAIPGAWDWKN